MSIRPVWFEELKCEDKILPYCPERSKNIRRIIQQGTILSCSKYVFGILKRHSIRHTWFRKLNTRYVKLSLYKPGRYTEGRRYSSISS